MRTVGIRTTSTHPSFDAHPRRLFLLGQRFIVLVNNLVHLVRNLVLLGLGLFVLLQGFVMSLYTKICELLSEYRHRDAIIPCQPCVPPSPSFRIPWKPS